MRVLFQRKKMIDPSKENLQRLYDNGKSISTIASELGYTYGTMYRRFIGLGIIRRSASDCHKGNLNAAWVDSPIHDKNLLNEEYIKNDLSTRKIAAKYKVSQRTIIRLMKDCGIKARNKINRPR